MSGDTVHQELSLTVYDGPMNDKIMARGAPASKIRRLAMTGSHGARDAAGSRSHPRASILAPILNATPTPLSERNHSVPKIPTECCG